MRPVKLGRASRGTQKEMITSDPHNTPEPPSPEIARPTMKTAELGAAAQIKDPISNTKSESMKVHLSEYKVYSLPKRSWNAQVVIR
jgi:hypothetical protein